MMYLRIGLTLLTLCCLCACEGAIESSALGDGEDKNTTTSQGRDMSFTTSRLPDGGTQPLDMRGTLSEDMSSGALDQGVADMSSQVDMSVAEPGLVVPIRRLTNKQYSDLLQHVFIDSVERENTPVTNWFKVPQVEPGDLFSNEVGDLTLGTGSLVSYLEATDNLAQNMSRRPWLSPSGYVDCKDLEASTCTQKFIKEFAPKLYRRPLDAREEQALFKVYEDVLAEGLSEEQGQKAVLMAMILAPQTLYLVESDEPKWQAWHLASRLSYFIWNREPDQELYDRAKDGTLLDPKVLVAQANRMMDDPKFNEAIGLYFYELLGLSKFDTYYKKLSLDKVVNRDGMKRDFYENVARHYTMQGTLKDLLTQENEFNDPDMVAYYKGSYPGILTHPVFQWTHSGWRTTSPIERGVVIRENLILCGHLPPPPMNVAAIPDVITKDKSMRERLAKHREDAACAGCHELIDPVGLTFEAYDSYGLYREEENGIPVDASGALTGTTEGGAVRDAKEMQEKLAASQEVQRCFSDQFLRYALLRPLGREDKELRQELFTKFKDSGFNLRQLILNIAQSPAILPPKETRQ